MTRPRLLELSHGHQTVIDEDDWPRVSALTLYRGTNGYVYFSVWRDGRSQPATLHSFLMGGSRRGYHIDHIDGDKLNNRRSNLRFVTPAANQANRRRLNRNNTSGVRGVAHRPGLSTRNPWHAQITSQGRNRFLGLFATKDEAVAARRAAELDLYGEVCP